MSDNDPQATPAGATAGARTASRRAPGRRRYKGNMDARALEEATRADIIATATAEFVRAGFDGASINAIASKTKTSKMMLYYYFSNKADLYRAVLEAAYERMVKDGPNEDLGALPPLEALRRTAEQAFDLHFSHADFVKLVMAENLNDARTIRESSAIRARTANNIKSLDAIVMRGKQSGEIRPDCDTTELYLVINGLAFQAVSNMATLRISAGLDLSDPKVQAFRRRLTAEAAYRFAVAR